ncbi:MAG: hypothetical protein ACR2PK_02565 [Acidimicrobiales bacterium]
MARGLYHPFTGALYEQHDDGNVLVTDGESQGVFRRDGSWVEGEIRECDPQMCNWIAGPIVTNHRLGHAASEESG